MQMMAPIPGMSLTREPGNAPYEQPPLYDTAEDALAFYMEKFQDEDALDDMLFALEGGFPLEDFVESLTSVGAMEGYHSVDVKLLISPIIHEYLLTLATSAGIEVVEMAGPSREDKISARDVKRTKLMLEKALAEDVTISEESKDKAEEALEGEVVEEDSDIVPPPPTEALIKRRG